MLKELLKDIYYDITSDKEKYILIDRINYIEIKLKYDYFENEINYNIIFSNNSFEDDFYFKKLIETTEFVIIKTFENYSLFESFYDIEDVKNIDEFLKENFKKIKNVIITFDDNIIQITMSFNSNNIKQYKIIIFNNLNELEKIVSTYIQLSYKNEFSEKFLQKIPQILI